MASPSLVGTGDVVLIVLALAGQTSDYRRPLRP